MMLTTHRMLAFILIVFAAVVSLASPPATQPASFRLQSTVMGEQPKALVSGELVAEGDTVAGFRVVKIEARRMILERDGSRFVATMDSARPEPYRPPSPATRPASTQLALRIDGTSAESYKKSLAAIRASLSREERGTLDFAMDKILAVQAGVMKAAMINAYRDEGKSPLQLTALEMVRIESDAMDEAAAMMRETLNGMTAEEIAKLGGSCYRLLLEQEKP